MKNILIIIFFIFSQAISGQSSKWQFELNVGAAYAEPNDRLDFVRNSRFGPGIKNAGLNDEISTFNSIFHSIQLQKRIFWNIRLNGGLGLTTFYSNHSIPINYRHFVYDPNTAVPSDIKLVGQYLDIAISPNIGVDIILFQNDQFQVLFGSLVNYNMSLFKVIHPKNHTNLSRRFNIAKINPHSFEFYPTFGIAYNRLGFHIDYRILNLEYIDNAVLNDGVEIDSYNPTKFRFRMSYAINESKEIEKKEESGMRKRKLR